MDTGTEGLVPGSPGDSRVQAGHEEEEEEAAAPKMELEGRFSPQLSEEETPEEGHGTAGPEPNETSLIFSSESKCSPSLVEAELLGSTPTPLEGYSTANPLEGGAGGDEAGTAPQPLRPHPLVKSDIVNEISNLSQGDASASSFPGSELPFASPYHEGGGSFSMEMAGLTSTDVSLQKDDGASLALGEMDDSLLFDVKGEGEKGRRRSSPARSRVKQVTWCPRQVDSLLLLDNKCISMPNNPYPVISSGSTGGKTMERRTCAHPHNIFSLYSDHRVAAAVFLGGEGLGEGLMAVGGGAAHG